MSAFDAAALVLDGPLAGSSFHGAYGWEAWSEALRFLQSKGYRADADDLDAKRMKVSPRPTADFPQIYILDPDRNVIEINAEKLDLDAPGIAGQTE